jgi:hypothetical protein
MKRGVGRADRFSIALLEHAADASPSASGVIMRSQRRRCLNGRHLRPLKEGQIRRMFFGNPRRYVKPGIKATVIIGEFHAENLTVE